MKKLILLGLLTLGVISCTGPTDPVDGDYYVPTPHYTCDWVYDTWDNEYIYACFWVYYSEEGTTQELDLAASIADKDELMLQRNTEYYAEKFSLSTENATKVAKQLTDLALLEDRTTEDLADFAQRLYGVETSKIISAVGKAQLGEHSELDSLISEAARNLGASEANTKALIKELHGAALNANGIEL